MSTPQWLPRQAPAALSLPFALWASITRGTSSPALVSFLMANLAAEDRRLRPGSALKMAQIQRLRMTGRSFPSWPYPTALTRKAFTLPFSICTTPSCLPIIVIYCSRRCSKDPPKTSLTSPYVVAPPKALDRRTLPLRLAYLARDNWMPKHLLISQRT